MKSLFGVVFLSGSLLLGLVTTPTALAMGGYTSDQLVTGMVQDIDYTHHAITVNGQTYAVSDTAKFSGIGGFSVLHIGMPVECMLSSVPDEQADGDASPSADQSSDQTPVIVAITWVPGGA